MKIMCWNIYEVTTESTLVNGVMLRGRLRKIGLKNEINVLAENASDKDNCVRFALINGNDLNIFLEYLHEVIGDSKVEMVLEGVKNPVLSKLKVNIESRYSLYK